MIAKPDEVYAYLMIEGFNELGEISDRLGLRPTVAGNRPHRNGVQYWQFSTSPSSEPPDVHLEDLLSRIEPVAEELIGLSRRYFVAINCVGHFSVQNPGFQLDQKLIARLARLQLDVDFDLYNRR